MSLMLPSSLAFRAAKSATMIMHALVRYLDPRRSMASAIGWLIFALSIGLVLVASVSVSEIVHTDLLDQRGRQLGRSADHIAAELNLNLALRLQSVSAVAAMLASELRAQDAVALRRILGDLQQASPELAWIGVANRHGRILAATHEAAEGANVADKAWFALGLKAPRSGIVRIAPSGTRLGGNALAGASPDPYVELIAPVIGPKGRVAGVIATQLSRRWLLDLAGNLADALRGEAGTETLVLAADGTVLIGPESLRGKHWESAAAPERELPPPRHGIKRPYALERWRDGGSYLVARANRVASHALYELGWRVAVFQPLQQAVQPARALQIRITGVLMGLGVLAVLLGVWLTQRITRRLEAMARSADSVRTGAAQRIDVPAGRNEAARLGRALDQLLSSLQRERSALQTLNAELDQRVADRTREIERLADEARYAAVVRERLKIARDLHDTLAHSMMAMLSEIRLLKRLAAADPDAVAEELARAEEAAQQGLNEARAAIAQMRFNPVRDAGLASALSDFSRMFVERTGIPVEYTSDAQTGAFADERAETLFRIAEEALRNIEHHAGATRASVSLRARDEGKGLTLTITDNGVGFDARAPHPGHYGLAGLREQAQLIGAALNIESAPHRGTTVRVELAPKSNP